MSPAHLEILMHFYTSPMPHPKCKEAWFEQLVSQWKHEGIIEPDNIPYTWKTTDKGNAWCQLILDTPQPVKTWSDPRMREGL